MGTKFGDRSVFTRLTPTSSNVNWVNTDLSPNFVAAIVLAAGKSERMGQPKALLPFRGKTFLENILSAISQSAIRHTVVVVGHHKTEIASRVPVPNLVFN